MADPPLGDNPLARNTENQATDQLYDAHVTSSTDPTKLRFQRQKPNPTASRKEGERPLRPHDIAVSSTPERPLQPQTNIEPASPTHPTTQQPQQQQQQPTQMISPSGRRPSSPMAGTASPLGGAFRAASPRHLSPATSQIFERDVQEPTVAPELSPAIPSHIQTEDHIPPVLEASSKAITDDQLDPDDVEIVMHSQHLPAVVAIAESTSPEPAQQQHSLPQQLLSQAPPPSQAPLVPMPQFIPGELAVPTHEPEESGSTYGTVDPTDPRRLSFISFADVVHAEHVETGKEPSHLMSPVSMAASGGPPRSPSPIRSPLSDRPPVSPPNSGPGSITGIESSPVRSGPGSTTSGLIGQGELTIETMRQTLQKTGSNDVNVQPSTPI